MTRRVVLADDHPIVLDGLRRLFDCEPDLEVVAACHDGEAALEALRLHLPDLLILDMRMPRMNGLAVLRCMAAERLLCRTIVLTADVRDDSMTEAIRFGVCGVVPKDAAPSLIVECARTVLAGGRWFEPQLLERLLARESTYQHFARIMTARELEIARLVAGGLRNREIATDLQITEGTVKIHLHSIYEKLGVTNRVELANQLREAGMLGLAGGPAGH